MPKKNTMFSSAYYRDARERRGGNPGARSYGRLAKFKADFLNTFFEDNKVGGVLEFGCGDGNQLVCLRPERYVGFGISPAAGALCRQRHSGKPALSFFRPEDNADLGQQDVTLALDVLYHLIEIEVFSSHLMTLFRHGNHFVIIYYCNVDAPRPHPHLKHRKIKNFVQDHITCWHLSSIAKTPIPVTAGTSTTRRSGTSWSFPSSATPVPCEYRDGNDLHRHNIHVVWPAGLNHHDCIAR